MGSHKSRSASDEYFAHRIDRGGLKQLLSNKGKARRVLRQQFKVAVHHHSNQFFKADGRLPTKLFPGLRVVPLEVVYIGRTQEFGIKFHMIVPIQPGSGKGDIQKVPYGMSLSGRDYIVAG